MVSGGEWQTKFNVSPGPGLWSLVLGPYGPDLGPDLDLTSDLDLDLSLTINILILAIEFSFNASQLSCTYIYMYLSDAESLLAFEYRNRIEL